MPKLPTEAYSCASGEDIYGGMVAPSAYPAWLAGQPLNQYIAISGTTGPGEGLNMNAYGGWAFRAFNSTILCTAQGGHSNGSSNASTGLCLEDDAPSWHTYRTTSTPTADVLYYADGSPTSRHGYDQSHWYEPDGVHLLVGCNFGYGPNTPTGPGVDAFSPTLGDYLPRFTYPDITPWPAAGYGCVQDGDGNIWTTAGYKLDVAAKTWSKPGSGALLRYPNAYDSVRNKIFAMMLGNGQGGSGLSACELDPVTGNSRTITFNASSGLTELLASGSAYAGMTFCPLDGKFYFMCPQQIGKLYIVTPNSSAVWDVATSTPSGSVPAPDADQVLLQRITYVPNLKGIVLQSNQLNTLRFLRLAI